MKINPKNNQTNNDLVQQMNQLTLKKAPAAGRPMKKRPTSAADVMHLKNNKSTHCFDKKDQENQFQFTKLQKEKSPNN